MRTSRSDESWMHPDFAYASAGVRLADIEPTVAYGQDIAMLKEFYYRGYFISPDLRVFTGFSKPFVGALIALTEEAKEHADSVLGANWYMDREDGHVYISKGLYDPVLLMSKLLKEAPLIKDPNTADFEGNFSTCFPKTLKSTIYNPDSNDVEHDIQDRMLREEFGDDYDD